MKFKQLGLVTLLLVTMTSIANAESFPITVKNCGKTETFTKPPARVVTIGQHETELLLALGLGEKIKGTSVWFGALPKELMLQGRDLKRLANNAPSFESVLQQSPELVLSQYSWHVGEQGEVGTRQQFSELGINTWISPADCTAKSVTQGSNGDGVRTEPYSISMIYNEIADISRIFGVPSRGKALTRQLAERIDAAQHALPPRSAPLKVVYWFSSARLQGDPWIAGNQGAPAWINRVLGLTNIINLQDEWPTVSWEQIAQSQPDIIVIASMDRRLYPADDAEIKEKFLEHDAVTKEMSAVKNHHIVIVPAMSLNPSMRNVEAVEIISKKIAAVIEHR